MTHLGQRLSALIDGELDAREREGVLLHLMECRRCSDDAAALQTLKRRMRNAVVEAAAGAGLTGRLMGLSSTAVEPDVQSADLAWPPPPPPNPWPETDHHAREVRAGRFFIAGSLAVFLAGLGTVAVLTGGDPQAKAPAPPVAPSVDVIVAPRTSLTGPPQVQPQPVRAEKISPFVP